MDGLAIRSERVFLPDNVRPATLLIEDGRLVEIASYDVRPTGVTEINVDPRLVVLPGLVDTHVHINDPGRAHWEGFETATRAAAAGGVTTVVDMPLNSIPPTTTLEGLEAKRAAAAGRCFVDVAFWGGVVPGNSAELEPLARAGVRGFKCFMAPSGVEEFPHVTEADLREAMPVLRRLDLPLLAHAELPEKLLTPVGNPRQHETWQRSRPPEAEQAAIELLVKLAREYGTRVHIVHLASAEAVAVVKQARAEGLRITGETCPHYLTFAAEDVPDGATEFKCAPPIRERRQQEMLWEALGEGDIDLVVTDHSPAPPSTKCVETGDFIRAWGGIASLQFGLLATLTGAWNNGIDIDAVVQWMSSAPANLAGLAANKGSIVPGADADLVVFDLHDATWVDPERLHHRHPLTPYAGMLLQGAVRTTILRGEVVFQDGVVLPQPRGKMIASGR